MESTPCHRIAGPVLAGLASLGPDSEFIATCYSCLLGRSADEQGSAYYEGRLNFHGSRPRVVRELAVSDEFERRYRPLHPIERIPVDVQLCKLANPAKWSNPEWVTILRSIKSPVDKGSMHRKGYEYAQTIYGLQRLGRLQQDTTVLSVGAGHESILYWLANHVGRVIASDRYDRSWSKSRGERRGRHGRFRPRALRPISIRRGSTRLSADGRPIPRHSGRELRCCILAILYRAFWRIRGRPRRGS